MTEPVDVAFEKLTQSLTQLKADSATCGNEADCRLRVIDPILIDVLGWPKASIDTEVIDEKKRIDYILKDVSLVPQLIVEAKSLDTFELPSGHESGRAYKLSGPVLRDAAIQDAIAQVAEYCRKRFLGYCAVTNGNDWLVFKGNRTDSIPVEQGYAFFFQGIDSLAKNFRLFYSLLHREALHRRTHLSTFAEVDEGKSATFAFNRAVRPENRISLWPDDPLADEIGLVCHRYIAELQGAVDPEVLDDCFVETRESEDAELRLTRMTESLAQKVRSVGASGERLVKTVASAVAVADSKPEAGGAGELVLLAGVKGSGKSTFVSRFFRRILPKELRERCAFISVDVGTYSDDTGVGTFVSKQFLAKLDDLLEAEGRLTYDHLQGAFFSDYQRLVATFKTEHDTKPAEFKTRFGNHVEGLRGTDPQAYIAGLVGHIAKGWERLPVVVFDNADHFSPTIQEEVFRYAVAISRNAAIPVCLAIIPVTERTIWVLAQDSAFNSYPSTKFYLPAPPAEKVIERRVAYVSAKLKEEKLRSVERPFGGSLKLSFANLFAVIESLQESLTKDASFFQLVAQLANGNIRDAFELFERVMTSGFLKLSDLVAAWVSGELRAIPHNRLIRALLKGDYLSFHSTSSKFVANVFSLSEEKRVSPLLPLRILACLRERDLAAKAKSKPAERDVPLQDVVDYFGMMGVAPTDLAAAIDPMLAKVLIESSDPLRNSFASAKSIAITPRGLAHLALARSDHFYIDSMAEVTLLHDEATFNNLRRLYDATPIDFGTVKQEFARYLLNLDRQLCLVPQTAQFSDQAALTAFVERYAASKS